jgi:hypothetical protein
VYRWGLLALVAPLLFLTALRAGDDDKKKPDPGNDKDKKFEKEIQPPPVVPVTIVELKDGSTFQAEWLAPPLLAFTTTNLGAIRFKREEVRFIDLEGAYNRISTQELDTYYGTLETSEVRLRLLATDEPKTIPLEQIKRLVLPARPRPYGLP